MPPFNSLTDKSAVTTMRDFIVEYCSNIVEYINLLNLDLLDKLSDNSSSRMYVLTNKKKLYNFARDIYYISDIRLIREEEAIFDGFLKKMMILLPSALSNSDKGEIKLTAVMLGYLSVEEALKLHNDIIIIKIIDELEQDLNKVKSLSSVLYETHSDCIEYLGPLQTVIIE